MKCNKLNFVGYFLTLERFLVRYFVVSVVCESIELIIVVRLVLIKQVFQIILLLSTSCFAWC